MKRRELKAAYGKLQRENEALRRENAALREKVAELQAEVAGLKELVEQLRRAGKRQAGPFRRDPKRLAKKPERPGRKKGQGKFNYRAQPDGADVDQTKEQPLDCCPECGGALTDVADHEHYEVDIPPVRPVTTRYHTQSGYCAQCGKRVRSRHPDQISQATGAAGVVVGPRAKALAADMKHQLGVSYGKISDFYGTVFGLSVVRGTWCRADIRLADRDFVGLVVGVLQRRGDDLRHSTGRGSTWP